MRSWRTSLPGWSKSASKKHSWSLREQTDCTGVVCSETWMPRLTSHMTFGMTPPLQKTLTSSIRYCASITESSGTSNCRQGKCSHLLRARRHIFSTNQAWDDSFSPATQSLQDSVAELRKSRIPFLPNHCRLIWVTPSAARSFFQVTALMELPQSTVHEGSIRGSPIASI